MFLLMFLLSTVAFDNDSHGQHKQAAQSTLKGALQLYTKSPVLPRSPRVLLVCSFRQLYLQKPLLFPAVYASIA